MPATEARRDLPRKPEPVEQALLGVEQTLSPSVRQVAYLLQSLFVEIVGIRRCASTSPPKKRQRSLSYRHESEGVSSRTSEILLPRTRVNKWA